MVKNCRKPLDLLQGDRKKSRLKLYRIKIKDCYKKWNRKKSCEIDARTEVKIYLIETLEVVYCKPRQLDCFKKMYVHQSIQTY